MQYLVKNKRLELKYVPGKGAWTYHLEIPGTKEIKGKWGEIKVSGSVDGHTIEKRNLAPIKGADKIISINDSIRKAINKKGGDFVSVTLYLDDPKECIDKNKIIEVFKDADVFNKFKRLPKGEQTEVMDQILSAESEKKQIQLIVKYIDSLG
ncbi:MAG: DUF1905 domain-containing protein [Chitinophagaceae bacterium]|nr:DUF1905 domain-containing protein [Chitinophagaceae bacterium]